MSFETIPDFRNSRVSMWIMLVMFPIATIGVGYVVFAKTVDEVGAKAAGILVLLLCVATGVICYVSYFSRQHEFCYATLTVTRTEIVWQCRYKKTIRMKVSDCAFLGVELPSFSNKENYPFVYFSMNTYPAKYINKIDKMKNSEHFVKFWYTEELAELLMATFPKDRLDEVCHYYEARRKDWRKNR